MVVPMRGIHVWHRELAARSYRYLRPGIEEVGDRLELEVTDPFNNRIRFMEIIRP